MRKGSLEGSLGRRALSPPPQGLAAFVTPLPHPAASLPRLVTAADADPWSARDSGHTICTRLSISTGVEP
jgi:hypothetical protein